LDNPKRLLHLIGELSVSELQNASADEQVSRAELAESVAPQGAGELLKQAREAAGLHIAAMAVLLKVPVKRLEALEAGRTDLLPDAVFVRALASSVCRTLKIDASPVLARLPQTDAPKLISQGAGINTPFRSPGDGPGPSLWAQVSRPAVLAGLLLLLAALVLIFLPVIKTSLNDVKSQAADLRLTAPVTADSAAYSGTEKTAASALPINVPAAFMSPTASADVATLAQTGPGTTSAFQATTAGVAAPTLVVTPKPPSDTDVIVFTAKGQSWVEATDAKGQVVLRRVLNAGEIAGAAGVLPLKVVVGSANETQVQVRGKAFDLNAVAKDNVARFEVK
jgi:cytoskeleton protein RodZ